MYTGRWHVLGNICDVTIASKSVLNKENKYLYSVCIGLFWCLNYIQHDANI